jgi:signal transduction histidine kinase
MIEPLLAGMIEQLLASFDQPDSLERLCAAVAEVLGARWVQLWEERGSFGLRLLAQWGLSAEEERALRGTVLPPGTLAENAQRMTAITGRAARISGEAARAPAELYQLVLPRGQGNSGLLVAALRRQRESTRAAQLDRAAVERLAAVWFAHASLLRELDEATRLKSDFVSTMSHELRTPLNTLIGYTELLALEEFGPLTAEQREVLERMDHSARELLGLINTTLDLNRFEQQTEPLILESVDIRALIEELEREVVGTCQRRGLAFRSTIAPGITQMRTDRPKLKAILQHLLSNAIKFTEQGSVGIEVRASSGGLEFTVFDTGIGIDTDILPIIFEPFRQGERASTRRFGGVGLGLYIVRRLVEMMGGQVQVESQPGQGSQFRVWVPDRAIPPSSRESTAEPQS